MTPSGWLDSLILDLRFAARHFTRNASTTAILVAVIALGTGANAIVFSIVQSQFFRPAPAVPENDATSLLWSQERATPTADWLPRRLSQLELAALGARREIFADLAAWAEEEVVFHDGDTTDARTVGAQFVTPNFFSTLGVGLAAGEPFRLNADDTQDLTAVLSFAFAEGLYGDAAIAVGRQVQLNGIPVRIVGVALPRFQGAKRNSERSDIWVPISARATIARVPHDRLATEEALSLVARLAPNVSRDQATALMRSIVTNALPDSAARVGMARAAFVLPMHALPPGDDRTEDVFVFAFFMTMGMLVLLVAWTNVSSLIVAAAVGRRHEIAVRLALGASRARLVRQLVTESTLLALAGSAFGLTLAWWGLTYLGRTGLAGADIAPDPMTFVYVLAVAFATGILFGLSPALHATRGGVGAALREAGAGAPGRASSQRRFVAMQIALSQPLLVLLGVVVAQVISDYRPLPRALSREIVTIALGPSPTSGAALISRIAERPEVVGVAPEPLVIGVRDLIAQHDTARVGIEAVTPGWFAMLDVPLILGRDVARADTAATDVPVVIGSDLARGLWGDSNPIGRRLWSHTVSGRNDSTAITVVGVFDATRALPEMTRDRGVARMPRVFTARAERGGMSGLLVRTRGPAEPALPDLRRFVRAAAPSLPVVSVRTLEQADAQAYRATVKKSLVAVAGAALPVLLASLGLFGVVALAVRQRTREIGIRIAVGAPPMQVARMFLASGLKVSVVAVLLGLPLSVGAVKLGLSPIFTPEGNALLVGIVVASIQVAVATAATWVPARRAALVDPAGTLRGD